MTLFSVLIKLRFFLESLLKVSFGFNSNDSDANSLSPKILSSLIKGESLFLSKLSAFFKLIFDSSSLIF